MRVHGLGSLIQHQPRPYASYKVVIELCLEKIYYPVLAHPKSLQLQRKEPSLFHCKSFTPERSNTVLTASESVILPWINL